MTKEELIRSVASRTGQTQKATAQTLDAFSDAVMDALANGGHVLIQGFGKFYVRELSDRTGHNPATGQPMHLPARKVVRFRVGKELRRAVQ